MKRAIRLLIFIPLLLLLALFAGSNQEPATLLLWPTDFSLTMPLSLAILCAAGIAFLCGGLMVWIGAFQQRRQLRRAEDAVRLLEEQVKSLQARLAIPTAPNRALPPPAA